MIVLDGLPFPTPNSDTPPEHQGKGTLFSLLQHPSLVSASERLKATAEKRVSLASEGSNAEVLVASPAKHVYVFQREFATIDPRLVQLAGMDEATTCVGIVIRNQDTGMTSIAHLDSPMVVDSGLTQMLSSFVHDEADALVVHLIGGFEDTSCNGTNDSSDSDDDEDLGYSLPLCSKIIEALRNRREHFHVKTLCVLGHNTKRDSFGNACPIISGFLVDTSTGSVMPGSFDRSSRCPDEIVRRVRVTVSSVDPSWKGKLLETYDTHHDRFQIAPCSWALDWGYFAFQRQQLSDSEILFECSSSPLAEGPDFVENERRMFNYLINYPDWRQTFLKGKPRMFERTPDGGWVRFN